MDLSFSLCIRLHVLLLGQGVSECLRVLGLRDVLARVRLGAEYKDKATWRRGAGGARDLPPLVSSRL